MELWIRSQHRGNLIVANSLEVEARNKGTYEIWNYNNNYHSSFLGEYKTKERALEVLDEIQKYITPTLSLLDDTLKGKQVCQVGNILSMVYEMPKE